MADLIAGLAEADLLGGPDVKRMTPGCTDSIG
jgi:hypothetical protein